MYHQLWIHYEQNKSELEARNMKNIPSVLLSSFWHMKISNERRNRDATTSSSVFNSFIHWLMHFCFSTWHFFSSYAFDIITCKDCLFWKQLWKLLSFRESDWWIIDYIEFKQNVFDKSLELEQNLLRQIKFKMSIKKYEINFYIFPKELFI